jgi:uncharacterized protein YneF (UPF0154 family)
MFSLLVYLAFFLILILIGFIAFRKIRKQIKMNGDLSQKVHTPDDDDFHLWI